jgi:hypothetical protein
MKGLGAAFGGARAAGGPVNPNQAFLVGESGPELFVPNTAGRIESNAMASMGQNINMNFHIQAPEGRVSRQTQQQIASVAARALADAARRNN